MRFSPPFPPYNNFVKVKVYTNHSDYYQWTQYLFLQLFHNDYAYKAEAEVNWDPVDKTVLANEQIDEKGRSWRSGALAEKKTLSQWFVRTTKLAEDLYHDLEKLPEWPNVVKEMQKGWIGLKYGFEATFQINDKNNKVIKDINIFTTKIETIYGVTFIAIPKDYQGLNELIDEKDLERINEYEKKLISNEEKEKDGLLLESVFAIHPLTKKQLPIYICNYIIKDFGTEAIMGVPSHDDRDKEFANKFNIECIKVLEDKCIIIIYIYYIEYIHIFSID